MTVTAVAPLTSEGGWQRNVVVLRNRAAAICLCGKTVPLMGKRRAEFYDLAPHDCSVFCGHATAKGTACMCVRGPNGPCFMHGGDPKPPKPRKFKTKVANVGIAVQPIDLLRLSILDLWRLRVACQALEAGGYPQTAGAREIRWPTGRAVWISPEELWLRDHLGKQVQMRVPIEGQFQPVWIREVSGKYAKVSIEQDGPISGIWLHAGYFVTELE